MQLNCDASACWHCFLKIVQHTGWHQFEIQCWNANRMPSRAELSVFRVLQISAVPLAEEISGGKDLRHKNGVRFCYWDGILMKRFDQDISLQNYALCSSIARESQIRLILLKRPQHIHKASTCLDCQQITGRCWRLFNESHLLWPGIMPTCDAFGIIHWWVENYQTHLHTQQIHHQLISGCNTLYFTCQKRLERFVSRACWTSSCKVRRHASKIAVRFTKYWRS